MTKEELKAKLIAVNSTKPTPRSDAEITSILEKFEKSIESRKNITELNKATNSRNIIKEYTKEFKSTDIRLYECNGMGIFVKRNGDKATVTFSFLNPNDITDDVSYDARSFKIHALENYKLGKYTYEVDWKGRSEFAVYDAFVKNHTSFPGVYRNFSISTKIGMYDDESEFSNWDSLHQ